MAATQGYVFPGNIRNEAPFFMFTGKSETEIQSNFENLPAVFYGVIVATSRVKFDICNLC
jgi:hypothetical protein